MSDRQVGEYVAANAAARERLIAIVGGLSLVDFERSIGHGWTVKSALAHLAYWDRYGAERLDEWRSAGTAAVRWRTGSPDEVNDALLPEWVAAPADEVAREVIAAAESVDRVVEQLPDAISAEVLAVRPRSLVRARHRDEHLDEVERALSR